MLRRSLAWRPVLPDALIDTVLRATRDGAPRRPGSAARPIDFSPRAIARSRAAFERVQAVMDPAPVDMEREAVELPHCTAQRLRRPGSRPGHVILALHGGAYLHGSTITHLGAMARIMAAARCEVLSVDYRLAPEHAYPACLDDALDGYRHLLAEGTSPSRIAVGGSSAGGALTLALLQRLTAEVLPLPACAFVASPWADLTCSGPSHRDNADSDAVFSSRMIAETAAFLVAHAGRPADDPLLSPAFGSYRGAPPLRIDVSAVEALRSDAELIAAAFTRDGATVELHEHPSAPHSWPSIGTHRASRTTALEIGAFVDRHLAP